jgi:hypothetical protein
MQRRTSNLGRLLLDLQKPTFEQHMHRRCHEVSTFDIRITWVCHNSVRPTGITLAQPSIFCIWSCKVTTHLCIYTHVQSQSHMQRHTHTHANPHTCSLPSALPSTHSVVTHIGSHTEGVHTPRCIYANHNHMTPQRPQYNCPLPFVPFNEGRKAHRAPHM